ncbi:hypothetical protein GCM10020358_28740 [Amorphoplanes nipponensis]|uniref:Uncharacterized protein n=1 Tax=Actinoplanes nipponensis TaxID=135950 RepID=A0A919JJR9_9ACTN|nr:hypothetical protein [Actinoplanes nipponensis]GIE50412.1 hypothetical protein Ani05nite_39460 [Actinoplanes nipponensis]
MSAAAWGPAGARTGSPGPAIRLVLRSLATDAHRLPSADVLRLVRLIRASSRFDDAEHLPAAVECLLADPTPFADERDLLSGELLADAAPVIRGLSPQGCLSLLTALAYARTVALATILAAIDERLAAPDVRDRIRTDPDLAVRLADARDRLRPSS